MPQTAKKKPRKKSRKKSGASTSGILILVLVVLLALSAPTLAGLIFMGERLHGMVNDWKNKKARKHV